MVYDFESYAGVVKAWRCGKMFHGISTIQLKNPWNIEPLDTKFLSMRGVSEAPREMREQGLLFRVEREIDSKCAYFYSSRKLFKLDAF
ncbi:hypothetical protein CRE_24225 [Caenorhabditis remanei]|uniref:Uncharacterized protein n=2 Tax=Caenorhabditis remanei TaxID=31234 RepID=E3NCW8_CAERE|nr:hypothetical protein CRE_24225 [Caenorhabditis remanei]